MLTTAQVAQEVGVSVRSVERACKAGKLDGAVKHGRDRLVPVEFADPARYREAVGKPGRRPGVVRRQTWREALDNVTAWRHNEGRERARWTRF